MKKLLLAIAATSLLLSLNSVAETTAKASLQIDKNVQPVYPSYALERQQTGYAIVEFSLNEKGKTHDVKIIESSSSLFGRAAKKAMLKTRMRALDEAGEAVAVEHLTKRYVFELPETYAGH